MRHFLRQAAYVVAVFVIAVTATGLASLLPVTGITAWAVCVAAGCFATVAATSWLPYPCTCHPKDQP